VANDFFSYGIATMKGVGTSGFTTAKTYLTSDYATKYPNQAWGTAPTTLTGLAQTAPYVALFSDTDFPRHILTTYSFANGIFTPVNDVSPTQLANEYTEVYNLGVHLLSTYSDKTFILQNAEADWELLGGVDPEQSVLPSRVRNFQAFIRVRQRAVRDARAATPSSSKVFLAVECNRMLDDKSERMHRSVLTQVKPDIVSLTIYESINTWGTQAFTEATIESNLRRSAKFLQRHLGNQLVMYGEFTWPQDETQFTFHSLDVASLIQKVIDMANTLGVIGVSWWQIFDNEEQSAGVPRGFGIYSRDGNAATPGPLTDAGTKFTTLV
jgi:hypothetical protein